MSESLTSATDPVQAAIDILDWAKRSQPSDLFLAGFGASQAGFGSDVAGLTSETTQYYPGGNDPDRIKNSEDVQPSEKQQNQRLSQISLYVERVADATTSKHSAAGDAEIASTVTVEIWTNDGGTTEQWRRNILALFADFETDNRTATPFIDIYPDADIVDDRAQNFHYGSFAVEGIGVGFEEYRPLE